MKIVIATPLFPPERGVPAQYVYELARRLSKDHKVTVVTYANHIEKIQGVHIRTISKNRPLPIRLFIYTRALIRASRGAEIVYAQRAAASGLPAILASYITKVPVVINYIEDEAWERYQQQDNAPVHQSRFRRFAKVPGGVWSIWHTQRFVLRHATRVLVPSKHIADELVLTGGIQSKKVRICNNPSPEATTLPFEARKKEHRIYMNTPLVDWSDVATALRAVTHLKKDYPDIQLVVVGEGSELQMLQNTVQSNKLENHVTFLGYISKAETLHQLRSASIFLSTAMYADRPDPLFSAFREGVPVIATDIPGQREALIHEINALRIPPGNATTCADAIARIFENPEIATTLTSNASRQFEKKYSWDAHLHNLIPCLTVS